MTTEFRHAPHCPFGCSCWRRAIPVRTRLGLDVVDPVTVPTEDLRVTRGELARDKPDPRTPRRRVIAAVGLVSLVVGWLTDGATAWLTLGSLIAWALTFWHKQEPKPKPVLTFGEWLAEEDARRSRKRAWGDVLVLLVEPVDPKGFASLPLIAWIIIVIASVVMAIS